MWCIDLRGATSQCRCGQCDCHHDIVLHTPFDNNKSNKSLIKNKSVHTKFFCKLSSYLPSGITSFISPAIRDGWVSPVTISLYMRRMKFFWPMSEVCRRQSVADAAPWLAIHIDCNDLCTQYPTRHNSIKYINFQCVTQIDNTWRLATFFLTLCCWVNTNNSVMTIKNNNNKQLCTWQLKKR